jgi:multimeric flavodoxin WrbA
MKITIVNGSPRGKKSNSQYYINELEKLLPGNAIDHISALEKEILEPEKIPTLSNRDILVFCFPLYVDAIPSHLLAVLQNWETWFKKSDGERPVVYGLVNCGFFEGEQTQPALEILENWCERAGLVWGTGLGIGGSEMLSHLASVPIGHGPKKSLGKSFEIFAETILQKRSGPVLFTKPNFPRFLYSLMGSLSWVAEAKKNGISKKEMYRT